MIFFTVPYIAQLFNDAAEIQRATVEYIRIAGAALVFSGGVLITTSAFNAVGKPLTAALLSIVQMFGLYIPLSFVFSAWLGYAGIFVALAVSYAVSAVLGYGLFERFLRQEQAKTDAVVPESTDSV